MEVVHTKVWLIGFIIGTVLGSLVKALEYRSLTNRSFLGRSYCPKCKHKLHWYDLLPIVSYLSLRGKCRYCSDKISLEYLLVEVGMGILVGLLFWLQFQNFQFLISNFQSIFNFQFLIFISDLLFKTFFITILSVLFITDIKKMFIPDRVIIPAIWISLIYLVAITLFKAGYLYYFLSQTTVGRLLLPPHSDYFQRHALMAAEPLLYGVMMGALIAGFFMLLIIVTRGKGMGGGDVKLGGLMGLALGFPNGLVALLLSFLSGALVSLILILLGKKHFGQSIPFGPFLVLGGLIALFWGSHIVGWYLHLSI